MLGPGMLKIGSPLALIASVAALIFGPDRSLAGLALALSVLAGAGAVWSVLG